MKFEKPLSLKEEIVLIKEFRKNKCAYAQKKLLEANMGSIMCLAFRVGGERRNTVLIDELFQEGCLEFIKGLRRDGFNCDAGYKIISYLSLTIKKTMRKYISRFKNQWRLPYKFSEVISVLNKIEKEYIIKNGVQPSESYTNKFLTRFPTVTVKRARNIRRHRNVELDNWNKDYKSLLHEKVVLQEEPDITELIYKKERLAEIKYYMRCLSDIERNVVVMAFSDEEITFGDVGNKYGFSRQRAHQIYKQALKKIRRQLDLE